MKSNIETEQFDQEIEKWFEELEAEKPDIAKMAQAVMQKHDLDRKILDDFQMFELKLSNLSLANLSF